MGKSVAERNFSIHMSKHKAVWDQYVTRERARIMPLLTERGITLDQHQPNLIGERYLILIQNVQYRLLIFFCISGQLGRE